MRLYWNNSDTESNSSIRSYYSDSDSYSDSDMSIVSDESYLTDSNFEIEDRVIYNFLNNMSYKNILIYKKNYCNSKMDKKKLIIFHVKKLNKIKLYLKIRIIQRWLRKIKK